MASQTRTLTHSLGHSSHLSTQLSAAQIANGPADSVVVDFGALVHRLNEKEVEKLKELVGKLDEKELHAAGRYIREVETLKELEGRFDEKECEAAKKHLSSTQLKRFKKKKVELEKKSRWNLRSRGRVDEKDLKQAKDDIDEELGNATLPQCYNEIKKLLQIEKNPICAKALQEWSRKEALFTSRVERKKSKVADLKNEIYQLIGFFSVFQGVLLTAVSQSNLLHCNNLWSPIVLSGVASVVTIFGVVQKLRQIESFQNTIHSEEQSVKEVAARLNTLRNQGPEDFVFAKFEHRVDKVQETRRFFIYFSLVIASLVVFTVGFPISHWRILCYPGSSP